MPGNPLIDQGVLQRIRASVVWTNFPQLNVTAPYLDKEGIRLALEGEASMQHPTMTGVTQSPEPYLLINVTINLLKTQSLADAYKSQMEANCILGPGTVWPDVSIGGLSSFQLENMSIQSVPDLDFSGATPNYRVMLKGFYVINQNLFN